MDRLGLNPEPTGSPGLRSRRSSSTGRRSRGCRGPSTSEASTRRRPTWSGTSFAAAYVSGRAWVVDGGNLVQEMRGKMVVHVGFAISRIEEHEAKQVFQTLKSMGELGELDVPQPE